MNYPDGMTKWDWQHIDGEGHHRRCTWHEEYKHDCCKEAERYLRPEFSPPCWLLVLGGTLGTYYSTRIDYCPWCAEDLGRPDCICKEIDETEREEAMHRKGAI